MTQPVCPVNVFIFKPLSVDHSLIVLSQEPESIKLSFSKLCEKQTLLTQPVCQVNVFIDCNTVGSVDHSLIVLS